MNLLGQELLGKRHSMAIFRSEHLWTPNPRKIGDPHVVGRRFLFKTGVMRTFSCRRFRHTGFTVIAVPGLYSVAACDTIGKVRSRRQRDKPRVLAKF